MLIKVCAKIHNTFSCYLLTVGCKFKKKNYGSSIAALFMKWIFEVELKYRRSFCHKYFLKLSRWKKLLQHSTATVSLEGTILWDNDKHNLLFRRLIINLMLPNGDNLYAIRIFKFIPKHMKGYSKIVIRSFEFLMNRRNPAWFSYIFFYFNFI